MLETGELYVSWPTLFEFVISEHGETVYFNRLEQGSHSALETYLLTQVISSVMIMRGLEPIHATVVSRGGEAIGFLGDSGRGKTTLAAYFLTRGFRLITDDLLIIDRIEPGSYFARSGIPRLKLFADSLRLVETFSNLGPMNPMTTKSIVKVEEADFEATPMRVVALFSLEPPGGSVSEIRISRVSAMEAFKALSENCYNVAHRHSSRLARHFEIIGSAARELPVFTLGYPRVFADLPRVFDRVLQAVGEQTPVCCLDGN